jgi:hypothetical protein
VRGSSHKMEVPAVGELAQLLASSVAACSVTHLHSWRRWDTRRWWRLVVWVALASVTAISILL